MIASGTLTRIAHSSVLVTSMAARFSPTLGFQSDLATIMASLRELTLENLPHLTGVIVSHGHYDHYNVEAFKSYPDKQVPLAVKRGIAKKASQGGF